MNQIKTPNTDPIMFVAETHAYSYWVLKGLALISTPKLLSTSAHFELQKEKKSFHVSYNLIFTEKMKVVQLISPGMSKFWNLLEIRILVLLSLAIQTILTLTGRKRKNLASDMLSILLWVTYMVADWAVTVSLNNIHVILYCLGPNYFAQSKICNVSLSVLSNHARSSCDHSLDSNIVITLFWAPFLLLHLGGPDTITAYSLEDNELWRRHLLTLVSQVVVAAYVLLKAWTNTPLNILAIPVFLSGVVKCGQRVWVLWSANSEKFRESMPSPPDPGPNYARYMEEYSSKKDEGFKVSLEKLIRFPNQKLGGGNVGKMVTHQKLNACSMLLQVNTEIPPSKVKGDRSKSVLFDACRLAKSLQSLATAKEWDSAKKWELICHVWVEMLSYAASHCQWNHHAQQLTQGGELLTHVWLLMAHLGITEQFQISQGHERAKLNVE
ncbi:hypothetical protein CFP56_033783 [Quercus suber]|uniref:DUF4220 domain-containing protein n=1 Tax=Quercus suber TaxID=58331 RepID=A0AAW0LU76_QUESU